jgi:phosphorylase kinase alpha/beta subunit
MIVHNKRLQPLIQTSYSHQDISKLHIFLQQQGTFYFPALETGLFPAAHLSARGHYTGYNNVWVRDNIHIAHAHYVVGKIDIAVKNAEAFLLYFQKYRQRFEQIIHGKADPTNPMNRPHIRFDGETLKELDEQWSHAQNDALAYFLWLYCKLARAHHVLIQPQQLEILGLFPLFFQIIRYWEDEDSGHWEEARKIEASSIGAVVAALDMMQQLMVENSINSINTADKTVTLALLDELIAKGRDALSQSLPAECIQSGQERLYDSALLFLIYPLEMVNTTQADAILQGVITHLQGEHGIRRYLGDSFWCANYDELMTEKLRTADVSQDMSARDALVKKGEEAQWCIFDPIISTIYGKRFEHTTDEEYVAKQTYYFNRSLGQLTGPDSGFREFLCPELYYLKGDRYIPNDVTPLLWTQANLMIAFNQIEQTVQRLDLE